MDYDTSLCVIIIKKFKNSREKKTNFLENFSSRKVLLKVKFPKRQGKSHVLKEKYLMKIEKNLMKLSIILLSSQVYRVILKLQKFGGKSIPKNHEIKFECDFTKNKFE